MATAVRHRYPNPQVGALRNGDCMNQKEFHFLYEQMPEGFWAELINGIVFVAEPVGIQHGNNDLRLGTVLDIYRSKTKGVFAGHNVTVILGKKDEVQPDVVLRVLPAYGGQSKDTGKAKARYILGAPELIAEVAYSSRSIDLHLKRERYTSAGAREYLVVCLEPETIYWFDLRNNQELKADADGIFRSIVFPGLWVHAAGLLQLDYDVVMDVLNQGLKSKEHADFVKRLAAAREKE
jgi:Uma2 family endonuclease